jgi:hypothetical protein
VQDGLDHAVRDEDLTIAEDLARVDVEEIRAADDEEVGHGGRS